MTLCAEQGPKSKSGQYERGPERVRESLRESERAQESQREREPKKAREIQREFKSVREIQRETDSVLSRNIKMKKWIPRCEP